MGLSLGSAVLRARWRRAFEHRGEASPTRRWTAFFLAACAALFVAAAAAWQIACDRACIGPRVLWLAWAATLVVVLISGALLRDRLRAEGRSPRWVHIGIVALLLLALWLAGYGLGHAP